MVNAICNELIIRHKEAENTILQTIYFGGGTPSILTFEELQLIFSTIFSYYDVSPSAEITLEVNPDDFFEGSSLKKVFLEQIKSLKVNRLSIGIQSFFDEDLILMNRKHNAQQAKEFLKFSTQLFDNVSIDLIYGIPSLSNERWQDNITIALSYQVPHISAYALTVEPKTALHSLIKRGKIPSVKDEQAFEQFYILKEILENQGFIHYEFSNFSKENYFSRNNTAYWEQKKYIGIGPSAHSYNGEERSWNISHNIKYIEQIIQNIRPCEVEKLSLKDKYNELIMTGLRTKKGISLKQIEDTFGSIFLQFLLNEAKPHIENELLIIENQYIKTSSKGLFLSDGIASDLFHTD